jgi:hypothetical protein
MEEKFSYQFPNENQKVHKAFPIAIHTLHLQERSLGAFFIA